MILRFWSTRHVKHLEEEIDYLRGQVEHERQRAERAIDTLLALKLSVAPITVPTPREQREMESAIDRTLRHPEFANVGDLGEEP